MVARKLLVLDLDETLLYADEGVLEREPDHEIGLYAIYRRPLLDAFLRHVFERFQVAIWTSSSPAYAHEVCAAIFVGHPPPAFVWARNRCTPRRDFELDSWTDTKPLKKLKRCGYDLRQVVMVDDSPEKHRQNYGNLVQVKPYYGAVDDAELGYLAAYLDTLLEVTDIRAHEKRGWRSQMLSPRFQA